MNGIDFGLLGIRLLDVLDIFLVAIIIYYVYSLIRGTIAVNILIALVLIYGMYLLIRASDMKLLTQIFGGIISVGPIALIIVFQQEIRRFLVHIGKNISTRRKKFLWSFLVNKKTVENDDRTLVKPIIDACKSFARSHTGALLVFAKHFDEEYYQTSGEYIDAQVSKRLLESIFHKNSPLHDGAVVIVDFKIKTASSILPLSDSDELPLHFGLRHRAAIGITEVSDVFAVVVSEETGEISYTKDGHVKMNISDEELEALLIEDLF